MKVLATFDGSKLSAETLPTLARIAELPGAQVTLLAIEHEPHGKLATSRISRRPIMVADPMRGGATMVQPPEPRYAETKEQALDRRIAGRLEYLADLRMRLPASAECRLEVHLGHDPGDAIIEWAKEFAPDVIVMATHGRSGISHAMFGSTAEKVVRCGVAPVLLVRPKGD